MSARKIRRLAEHKARKLAQKAGFPLTSPPPTPAVEQIKAEQSQQSESILASIPEPSFPLPALSSISPARMNANRLNAKLSTGPLSDSTKAVSAQNHTIHGLARHVNGTFKLMGNEDSNGFEAFKQSLVGEHEPATPTESILVNAMVESHRLAQRAQRLQDTCLNPEHRAVTDEKKFNLYMRYQATHTRSFHKSLNDLIKLRSEKRKVELGFEAQKHKEEQIRIQSERHEMKKQEHYWTLLKKDAEACSELSKVAAQNCQARRDNPGFEAEYEAELAKRGLEKNFWEVASKAA